MFPAEWRFPAGRQATFAQHAIVASNNRLAAEVGAQVMKQGGNAVDGAVATGFALAVTYPEAGNLGGGGYMVIRMADGRTAAIDYREAAPLAATRDMYVGANGKLNGESLIGPKASGVPGSVAGMVEAQRKYGALPLAKVMAPAIRLAAEGFIVDSAFFSSLSQGRHRIDSFREKRFSFPTVPPTIGRDWSAAAGATLKSIAASGSRAFYHGAIADSIAGIGSGGLITKRDLAATSRVAPADKKHVSRIHALLHAAVVVGRDDDHWNDEHSRAYGPIAPFGAPNEIHAVASASQRAFIDRNSKLSDPAFVKVPLGTLTSSRRT